jgi:hypothetical protein
MWRASYRQAARDLHWIRMATDLPIACSLTAAERPARLAEMAAIGTASLLGVETGDASATLRFRKYAETRERLEAIVAAEAECCAFMAMTLGNEPEAIVLTIDAPAGAEPVMRQLVRAFGGS